MRHILCGITLLILSAAPDAQQERQTVRAATAGVLIDVTVVDSEGRPVIDLTANDFEIREDGKPQQIVSAALVRSFVPTRLLGNAGAPGEAAAPAAVIAPTSPAPPPPAPPATPTVTAILFDSLSADARPLAVRGAAQFISTLATGHEYAGIFQAGLSLTTVQPFTNQPAALRKALDGVATMAPSNLSPADERSRSSSRTAGLDPSAPVTAGAEEAIGWTTVAEHEQRLYQSSDPALQLIQMEQRMKEGYMRFLSEYEGDAALSGLRATVTALAPLPGRKSLLYFCEELPITSRLKSRFDTIIGEANRANITIYPVDAAGLRIHSKESEVGHSVALSGAQGIGDARRPDGPMTKELEQREQELSSRPAAVLGRLAGETGGFMIDNTNDLGKGVARMQVERTTYYLLGYQPTNATPDGKFRKISVKVKRSGKFTVRARTGYLAPAK
jgi:VWFA-related protein